MQCDLTFKINCDNFFRKLCNKQGWKEMLFNYVDTVPINDKFSHLENTYLFTVTDFNYILSFFPRLNKSTRDFFKCL